MTVKQAVALVALGRLREAEELLVGNGGASLAPTPEAALLLAEIKIRHGDVLDAKRLLCLFRDEAGCWARLRELLAGERDYAELMPMLTERLRQNMASALDHALYAQIAGDLDRAERHCRAARAQGERESWVCNQLGKIYFNRSRDDQAKAILERAVAVEPGYSEAWHSLAHVLRAVGEMERAVDAYGRALTLAPAYRSALLGRGAVWLELAKPELAKADFQKLLRIDDANAEAWVNLGMSHHILHEYDAAMAAYRKALELDSRSEAAFRQLGKLYVELGDADLAVDNLKAALSLRGGVPEVRAELLSALEVASRLDEAWSIAQEGLRLTPGNPLLEIEAAKLERRKGKVEQCLARLRGIDPRRMPLPVRQQYFFELGAALDRSEMVREAYDAFAEGNAIAATGLRARLVDRGVLPRSLAAMDSWLASGAQQAAMQDGEDLGQDLCFLIGFPRSGTTLLDVMLDGHPGVQCLEERQTIERVFHAVDYEYGGFPQRLSTLDGAQREALRRKYRDSVSPYLRISGGAGLILDKMPIRSAYALFIHRLFPKAKFVFSLRHPCDVVLSNFMQHYAANEVNVHFYTLEGSARVYAEVMRIWLKSAGLIGYGNIHYVRYERLVDAPEKTLLEVFDFLGLDGNGISPDHRSILERRGQVTTSSYHQVSEPLYRRSLGRWERYRDCFEPLLPLLRPSAESFGYSLE